MSVVFIIGLVMTGVALIMGPLLGAQSRTQAKVDTVQAASAALYRVERDLRNTNSSSIYACTVGGTPTCVAPSAALTSTNAIVLVSAYNNGTGQFQTLTSSGKPYWQGATVYWVDSAGTLTYAFDTPISTSYTKGSLLSPLDAQAAVTDVTGSGGTQLARPVELMSIAVPSSHQVTFQLQINSTEGAATNETTYQTDLETRN